MNILIVSPFYNQDKCIGSVRWTNLAQRLAKKHNVIVVTQPLDDMDMSFSKETADNLTVARLNQKTLYEKIAVKFFHGATGYDIDISDEIGDKKAINNEPVSRKIKNRLFYSTMKSKAKQYADEIVKNVIPQNMKIDVVISSACPFIEMLFGYELKKRLGCKWISDFRDLPFIEDKCDDTHIQKKIMKDILPNADAITVVLSGMKQQLINNVSEVTEKVWILTNGFSMSEARASLPNNDGLLHIVHTGSLYGGTRRADLLFDALSIIKQQGITDFIFECAGGNNSSLITTANKYGCKDYIKDFGFISRNEALDLQSKADCLLAMVETTALPAKLFEYVLNQKPIICLLLGKENDNCDARQFIEQLNVGKVFAEHNWENDVNSLVDYLKEQIERKKAGEKIIYIPNTIEVHKYNHDSLVLRLEEIIENI